MNDIIDNLRRSAKLFSTKPVYEYNGDATLLIAHAVDCAKAADKIEVQQSEIARLRELVESAYAEGWGDGVIGIIPEGKDAWMLSNSYSDLKESA